MAQDSSSRKLDQYIVRFPDGMRDRLKDEAAKNKRSLNAEIIARLEASFSMDTANEEYRLLNREHRSLRDQLNHLSEMIMKITDEAATARRTMRGDKP